MKIFIDTGAFIALTDTTDQYHLKALDFAKLLICFTHVILITPLIENKAWDIFKQYKDKDFSFTDCTSFIVIESLKINHVFVFDIHFKQFGLKLLPFL